jgi:hypothetical protein
MHKIPKCPMTFFMMRVIYIYIYISPVICPGHGDPMDFWDHSAWPTIPQNDPSSDEPLYTTPSLIRHVNPGIKLILLVRDPINRHVHTYIMWEAQYKGSRAIEIIHMSVFSCRMQNIFDGTTIFDTMFCDSVPMCAGTDWHSPIKNYQARLQCVCVRACVRACVRVRVKTRCISQRSSNKCNSTLAFQTGDIYVKCDSFFPDYLVTTFMASLERILKASTCTCSSPSTYWTRARPHTPCAPAYTTWPSSKH